MRPHYESVLDELELLAKLREFRPVVIGTPPLGIDGPDSDIDVACCAMDLGNFHECAEFCFGNLDGFSCNYIEVRERPAVCAVFWSRAWELELFCQTCPVEEQWGVRHFNVERRLLEIEPKLRSVVSRLKRDGLKTEPAFARVLQLSGDPYEALLALETKQDTELAALAANSVTNG